MLEFSPYPLKKVEQIQAKSRTYSKKRPIWNVLHEANVNENGLFIEPFQSKLQRFYGISLHLPLWLLIPSELQLWWT